MLRKVTYLALCSSIFLSMLIAGTWLKRYSDLTRERVEELIKSEVPSGASKSQVFTILDKHRIKHSEYVKYEVRHPELISAFKDKKLEGKTHRIKNYIFATIPHCSRRTWFRCEIQITFYFDGEDNFVEYLLSEVEDSFCGLVLRHGRHNNGMHPTANSTPLTENLWAAKYVRGG